MADIRQVVQRFSGMLVSLFGLSVIIFTISRLLPGNPARMALGPRATDEQVEAYAEQLGLNDPIPVQYVDYMRQLFTGDLGQSLQTRNPITEDLLLRLPATIELITVAFVFIVLLGVPLGVLAAKYHGGKIDNITRILTFSALSVPSFFTGILFQLLFGYYLNVLPITGRISSTYKGTFTEVTGFYLIDTLMTGTWAAHFDVWAHLIMPALALSIAGMGQIIRITRSSMIDVEGTDFVDASRAYGLPSWMVTNKYMFKNAFVPTLTILGLQYAWLLSGAFIIELLFSWPGVAKYGVNAVLASDINAVVAVVMVTGVAFVVANFVVDMIINVLDPRIELVGDD
jgi:peptide/nickel transport system permease protein